MTNFAAEKIPHQSRCLDRGLITEEEFASSCVAYLIDEPNSDPVPLLCDLPDGKRALIVAHVSDFAKTNYLLPSPKDCGSDEQQREYQSQAQIVCDAILAHFKP